MDREQDSRASRGLLGLALLVGGVVIGGGLLQATAVRDAPLWWFAPLFVLVAVGLIVVYVMLVFLPGRRDERELEDLRQRFEGQRRGVKAALDEMRGGDLVAAAGTVDELGSEMARTVEGTARSLAGLVQQIQTSSVEVATSARSVQETSSELASGSSQQAAAVVQITATMEELARTAAQIATNAASQAELAAHSEEAGNQGATAVQAAVEGVEAVRERMDAIADRADTLGSRSREIYQVLDLITEIAQETHILALNAAIEAAAAGEHGDRFSVVADEVRRLAVRSRESVDSVRGLLEEFSGAIRAVVVETEEGSKAAAQVQEQSQSAETSIEQLRRALSDTARAAREISLATQEQQGASDQVVLTLKEVSEVIQRMADGLKHFTGAADRLNQLALSIQLLAQSFRIDSTSSLKNQVLHWADELSDCSSNLEAVDGRLHDLIRKCPFSEMIYLVDPEGTMVAFAANNELVRESDIPSSIGVGQVYADRPWFQAVTRDGRTAVTPLYESLMTGEQCFTIATPVSDYGGTSAGVLGIDVNVRNWTMIRASGGSGGDGQTP
jgi:methyl-accepting chemotaxis protein